MEMDTDDVLKIIFVVFIIGAIVFSVFTTVKCWNVRLADRVGICALQHTR